MADPAPNLDLRDIPDVRPFIPTPTLPWWAWLLIALFLILITWLIFRKKSSSSEPSPQRAYQDALCALDQASTITQPIPLATTVSLILRRYLAATTGDTSLFETHEEFLSRHNALSAYPEEARKQISDHFNHIARLKYAPLPTTPDLTNFIPAIRSLLTHLHRLPTITPPQSSTPPDL